MTTIDLQIAVKNQKVPKIHAFQKWVALALQNGLRQRTLPKIEICIRIVSPEEITELNKIYRKKPNPTNILSFPYDIHDDPDDIPLLGDLVICADVIEKEAAKQGIDLNAHWAHIVIHGVLHLLGYDHIKEKEAEEMEAVEQKILDSLVCSGGSKYS